MIVRMEGLQRRDGVWKYRRMVPPRLRSVIGSHQIIRSLGTQDRDVALRRYQAVKDEVDRIFREAEQGVKSPAVAGYKAVEEWRVERAQRHVEDDEEDALDEHITMLLERGTVGKDKRNLDAHQRAVLEGAPEASRERRSR